MFSSNLLESSYQKYIEVHGEKVTNPSTNKPVKLTKTRFAQLYFGLDNWSELKKILHGINSMQEITDILFKENSDLNKIIVLTFKEVLYNSKSRRFNNSTVSLDDVLYLYFKTNELAENDLKFYKDNGLKKENLPISLLNKVKSILSDQKWRESITLGRFEYKFIAKNMWYEQNIIQKLEIIEKCKIPLNNINAVKYSELWNELKVYLNKSTSDSWRSLNSFNLETVRYVCSESIIRNLTSVSEIIELYKSSKAIDGGHLYNSDKGLFNSRTNLQGIEPLKVLFGAGRLGSEDIKILDFFDDFCTKLTLSSESKKRDSFFGMTSSTRHDDKDISFLLRSKSHLASPVLATYMLYNFGSSNFNIERLYAILYHMKRHPQLQPLIDKLEPLALIEEKLSYNDRDMQSEILAATILARNATDINSRDGFNAYKKTLTSVFEAGHYDLIIKECARLLNITMLEVEAGFIKNILIQSMVNISEYELERMPQLYIDAAYYIIDRLKLSTLRLEPYVSDEVEKISSSINSDDLIDILNLRVANKEKNYSLILKTMGVDLQRIVHQGMGYGTITESVIPQLSDLLNIISIEEPDTTSIESNECFRNGLTATLRSYLNKNILDHHGQVKYQFSGSNRRGRTRLSFFNERLAGLESLPNQVVKLYEYIKSRSRYNDQLYSINIIFHLYLSKVSISKIKEIADNCLIVSNDDGIDIYGSLSGQEDIYRILKTYKPNTLRIHSITDIDLVVSSYRNEKDKYSMGYTETCPKVVKINNIQRCDFTSIEKLESNLHKVNFSKYANKSPLENIIEKIAPKFTYYGFVFNPSGTNYIK